MGFVLFYFVSGHSQQCSGIILGFVFKDHSWCYLGHHICQRSNLDRVNTRIELSPVLSLKPKRMLFLFAILYKITAEFFFLNWPKLEVM